MLRIAVLCALLWVGGVPVARAADGVDWASTGDFALEPGNARDEVWAPAGTLLSAQAPRDAWSGDDPVRLGRDWRGIATDTAWFMGYQLLVGGIIYALPESVTDWTSEEKDDLADQWWENVRNPHWDSDNWFLNYVTHPYWGATYYIRARERGFGYLGSFLYSALLSTLFEFGMESFFEPPSFQDLIVTPVVGSLVGAFVFEPLRARIKAKATKNWSDKAIMVATDPLGGLNAVFERLFGIKSEIRLQFRPLSDIQLERRGVQLTTVPRGQAPRRPDGVGLGLIVRY